MKARAHLLGLLALVLAACQSTQAPSTRVDYTGPKETLAYSGYFIWESERAQGEDAYQCMQIVVFRTETLADGRIRFEGSTKYETGSDRRVDYVETELILDPISGTFEMRESSPTNKDFLTDGYFSGEMKRDRTFLSGIWIGKDGLKTGQDRGSLSLRLGSDAPCGPDHFAKGDDPAPSHRANSTNESSHLLV